MIFGSCPIVIYVIRLLLLTLAGVYGYIVVATLTVFAYKSLPIAEDLPASSLYAVNVWNSDDGLPGNNIIALCQTQDGYIWIGTYNGLARFDGVRFTVFTKVENRIEEKIRQQNAEAMQVFTLFEDKDRVLWVGLGDGGLLRYKNGIFTQFRAGREFPDTRVWSICQTKAGVALFGTSEGVYRYKEYGKQQFMRDSSYDAGVHGAVVHLLPQNDGSLWIGNTDGLYRVANGRSAPQYAFGERIGSVHTLKEDREGNIWVGTSKAAYCYKSGIWTVDNTLPDMESFIQDSRGNRWFGLSSGLVRQRSGRRDIFGKQHGMADVRVYTLLEDLEGNIWVGTYYGGLHRLKYGKFATVTQREGLSGMVVYSIRQMRNGTIWVGYLGGISALHHDSARHNVVRQYLRTNVVRDLGEGRQGELWIATYNGLHRWHQGSMRVFTMRDGLPSDRIRVIHPAQNGILWIGTNNGLVRFDGKTFQTFGKSAQMPDPSILTLYEDRSGGIWAGTEGSGVIKFRGNGIEAVYNKSSGLRSSFVFSLYEDRYGAMWAGTKAGLFRITGSTVRSVSMAQGLPDNEIFQILEDRSGNFWIGCNKGLIRIAFQELHDCADGRRSACTAMVYGKHDGMSSDHMNAPARACRTNDGRLWFPTDRGVSMLDPDQFLFNSRAPRMAVEKMIADNDPRQIQGQPKLEAEVGRIEIHYTALSFFAPEKVLFRYQLEGYDKNWVDAGTRRVAYYTNLPRGKLYRFRVIACNNDGVWNTVGSDLSFTVAPYWYETWWWYSVCILIGVGVVMAVHRQRLRGVQRRNIELEGLVLHRTDELQTANQEIQRQMEIQSEQSRNIEIANAELQELNEQLQSANRLKTQLLSMAAHDLKNPLAQIIGFAELVGYELPEHGYAQSLLAKVQNTAQQMNALVKDLLDSAAMEFGNIVIYHEELMLSLLLLGIVERYRLAAAHKQQRIIVENLDEVILSGDRSRLEQVFDNLLSNAVKYSPIGKTIRVRVIDLNTVARVEVEDEGPGLSAEDQSKLFGFFQRLSALPTGGESSNGVGLAIVKKIVDLHKGRIWCESEPRLGAKFIVELPNTIRIN